ncbi:MAG: GspH/FimT family pseudopilin [Halieaceae bacterium]|jgi:type IV fimbrial biogenesis protein FimT|nr:GspH/FimT family pseudopilin [Halieaceae bacterium]
MFSMSGKQRGISLVELMSTISIIAIVNAVAGPALSDTVRRNQLQSQADRLLTSFHLARSEAVKRNTAVSICRSSDGTSCTGDWRDGWIVFSNLDGDNVLDAEDEVIRVYDELSDGHALAGSLGTNALTYFPDGSYANGSDTISVCVLGGDLAEGYTLSINRVGRPRASKGASSCS